MATDGVSDDIIGDKYRSHWYDDAEKSTLWRHGGSPSYDIVNKLFEEGRTQEWPKGSLEETVQNAMKMFELELSHKTRLQDFTTINPNKFKLSVNGRRGLPVEEILQLGNYNAVLQSSLPEEYQYYKPHEETFESSREVFRTAFPRGFAWELLSVFSGPPVITFKFRHWGFVEGPYKGHAPTGERVQLTGMAVLKVDEQLRAEEFEAYFDPGELFGGLLKGPPVAATIAQSCPFLKGEGVTDVTEK